MTLTEARELIAEQEIPCAMCGPVRKATCLSHNEEDIVGLCDQCCGHGGEEGECLFIDPER